MKHKLEKLNCSGCKNIGFAMCDICARRYSDRFEQVRIDDSRINIIASNGETDDGKQHYPLIE